MPIYEYRCSSCDRAFEELVFGDEVPACPACGSQEANKLMSAHAVGKAGGGALPVAGPCGGCEHAGGPRGCQMN